MTKAALTAEEVAQVLKRKKPTEEEVQAAQAVLIEQQKHAAGAIGMVKPSMLKKESKDASASKREEAKAALEARAREAKNKASSV
jgi:hypothetical protein